MEKSIREYLSTIGRRGGMKSRRTLSAEQAQAMVRLREAQKAYRKFHTQCFWSYAPNYKIGFSDVAWVADQLMKHGSRAAWEVAQRLCP